MNKPHIAISRTWILAIAFPLTLILFHATPFGWNGFLVVILLPAVFAVWALNSLWAAVLTVRLASCKRWSEALALSLLPVLLVAIAAMPRPFLDIMNDLGDEIHFLVMRHPYLEEIAKIPPADEPRLVEFDLGGMIWIHGAIVYDESDGLDAPSAQPPQAWDRTYWLVENGTRYETRECKPEVHPFLLLQFTGLAQHFYRAVFPC